MMAKYHKNKIMLSQRYSLPVCSFENRRRYVHGLLVWGKWDSVLSKVFLFVCVEFIVPLENVSLIWRCHHCRWWAANYDLRSALMGIEQRGFFNVTQLLWHWPTLNYGHLRSSPVCERLAVKLSPPVFTTQVCRDRGSNPDLSHARRMLYLYATAVDNILRRQWNGRHIYIHDSMILILV